MIHDKYCRFAKDNRRVNFKKCNDCNRIYKARDEECERILKVVDMYHIAGLMTEDSNCFNGDCTCRDILSGIKALM